MIQTQFPLNQGREEIFLKYKFVRYEMNGRILLKVYNLKAKKEYRSLIYHYSFRTSDSREQWITNFKSNMQSWEDRKAKRAQERKNFVNPYKPGDILYNSWGYEQTNIDFYQVLEVKGKTIKIREIAQKLSDYASHGMAAHTVAVKDTFMPSAPVIEKRVTNPDYITFNSYSSLSKWDGRALYCSWYG